METRNKLGYKEIERIKNDSLSTDHRPTHDEIALYNYRLCASIAPSMYTSYVVNQQSGYVDVEMVSIAVHNVYKNISYGTIKDYVINECINQNKKFS